MWFLQPPYKVFDYLNLYDNKANFQSIALISKNIILIIQKKVEN